MLRRRSRIKTSRETAITDTSDLYISKEALTETLAIAILLIIKSFVNNEKISKSVRKDLRGIRKTTLSILGYDTLFEIFIFLVSISGHEAPDKNTLHTLLTLFRLSGILINSNY